MVEFVSASALILAVMVGWLYVQDLYARFAIRHPELGPYRKQGGCGDGSCSRSQGGCPTDAPGPQPNGVAVDLITPDRLHN
ncbi:MAG: hypothetical protein WBM63_12125 [Sedimenticolaceae bacterium]|jgi:hypothetical protein